MLSLESVTAACTARPCVELYGEPYRSLDEVLREIDADRPRRRARGGRGVLSAGAADDLLTLGPATIVLTAL